MKISDNLMSHWRSLYEHGDYIKIANASGLSRITVLNAFKYLRASSATITAINKFYSKKQKLIVKLNSISDGN